MSATGLEYGIWSASDGRQVRWSWEVEYGDFRRDGSADTEDEARDAMLSAIEEIAPRTEGECEIEPEWQGIIEQIAAEG